MSSELGKRQEGADDDAKIVIGGSELDSDSLAQLEGGDSSQNEGVRKKTESRVVERSDLPDDVFDDDENELGNDAGDQKEDGVGGVRIEVRRPSEQRDTSWWETDEALPKSIVEALRSGEKSVPYKLDRKARDSETDYWSRWDESPQPDGGEAAIATAKAYRQRIRDLEAEGKVTAEQTHTVCHIADNTKSASDFMETLRREDAQLAERTKGVVLCDPKRADLLKSAQVEDDQIQIHPVDVNRPENIQLPKGTTTVMVDGGVINSLESYRLVRVGSKQGEPRRDGNKGLRDIKTSSYVYDESPLVQIDPDSGEPYPIQPYNWLGKGHNTAEGNPEEYTSQIIGRLVHHDSTLTQEEDGIPYKDTALEDCELDVRQYMNDKPAGRAYSYSPAANKLIERVTSQVSEGGVVVVSGYIRDDPRKNLKPTDLVQQQRKVLDTFTYAPLSPVRHNVVEGEQIRNAAQAATNGEVTTTSFCGKAGEVGHILIDRATGDTVSQVKEVVQQVANAAPPDANGLLKEFRSYLEQSPDVAPQIEEAVEEILAGDENYKLARNYDLRLALARLYNDYGQADLARRHAEKAVELFPISSAAQVEVAKAAIHTDNYNDAYAALNRAHELSPQNADIYKTSIEIAIRQKDTAEEVDSRIDYLRHAPALKPQELIHNLGDLCEAMQRDYEAHKDHKGGYKTIVVHNLERDEYLPLEIPAHLAKQMRAARAAVAARETAQQIFNQNPEITGQEIRQAITRFDNVWENTRLRVADVTWAADDAIKKLIERRQELGEDLTPQEAGLLMSHFTNLTKPAFKVGSSDPFTDQTPVPMDQWDRPADNCRMLYAGRLCDGDDKVPPDELFNIPYAASVKPEVSEVKANSETGKLPNVDIPIGKQLAPDNSIMGEVAIPKKDLRQHTIIVGQSGSGKSIDIRQIMSQAEDMGVNVLLMDAGDRPGLLGAVEELKAKGRSIYTIDFGADDAPPISVDFLRPVDGTSLEKHMQIVSNAWMNAYGDQEGPVPVIVRFALEESYAATGWDIITTRERKGEAPMHKILENPPTPTLSQFVEFFKEGCKKYVGDAGNLIPYIENRERELGGATLNPIVQTEGSSAIDYRKFMDADVYTNYGNLEPRHRRFISRLLMDKRNAAVAAFRGEVGELRTVIAIDEVQTLAEVKPGDPDAKQAAVEAFATDTRENRRGYGDGMIMGTQSPASMHPLLLGQNATTIIHKLSEGNEKRAMAEMGLEPELAESLDSLKPGVAYIRSNGETKKVRIHMEEPPSPEAIAAAEKPVIDPPLKKGLVSHEYTKRERREATAEALQKEQTWLRITVGAIADSHRIGTELPSRVPDELQERWATMTATDRRKAELIVQTVVEQNVRERGHKPPFIEESILATTMDMLDKRAPIGPGRYASPSFRLPQLAWAQNYNTLTTPHSLKRPPKNNLASPPEGVEGLDTTSNKRVGDLLDDLERHPLSPHSDPRNVDIAYTAVLGPTHGKPIWRDLRTAAGGEPNTTRARRIVAEQLGLIPDRHYPGPSVLEKKPGRTHRP